MTLLANIELNFHNISLFITLLLIVIHSTSTNIPMPDTFTLPIHILYIPNNETAPLATPYILRQFIAEKTHILFLYISVIYVHNDHNLRYVV